VARERHSKPAVRLVWAIRQAFKTNPWFRWGQEYKGSKDSMHFELQAYVKNKDGLIRPQR
jgi:D-alanyl-D-alanine carboxypeptidase